MKSARRCVMIVFKKKRKNVWEVVWWELRRVKIISKLEIYWSISYKKEDLVKDSSLLIILRIIMNRLVFSNRLNLIRVRLMYYINRWFNYKIMFYNCRSWGLRSYRAKLRLVDLLSFNILSKFIYYFIIFLYFKYFYQIYQFYLSFIFQVIFKFNHY